MQEVNEIMNEMSEFYDESEETSDLIEERLAKTINTSLRENISESKFKLINLLHVYRFWFITFYQIFSTFDV
jgi:hypothetical protein